MSYASARRRTNEELNHVWDEIESLEYNNENEWKNKQISYDHWFSNGWVYCTKKVQIFCQICMNDNVAKEVVDDYILMTAIYYNDNYIP